MGPEAKGAGGHVWEVRAVEGEAAGPSSLPAQQQLEARLIANLGERVTRCLWSKVRPLLRLHTLFPSLLVFDRLSAFLPAEWAAPRHLE